MDKPTKKEEYFLFFEEIPYIVNIAYTISENGEKGQKMKLQYRVTAGYKKKVILSRWGIKQNPDQYYINQVKEHIQTIIINKHNLNKRSALW